MPHEIPEYMSANYVKDKTSVDILWRQLHTLQDIAQEFGIDNIFQDNGAEILQQLIYLNMKAVPGREGNDGIDVNGCEWEMKSLDISKGNQGITTNHHLNASIIEKYKTVPWSVAIYDGIHLKKIYIVGNEQLQYLFENWEAQLQTRESINNPKIPLNYIEEHGILIYQEGDDYPINPMSVIDTTIYVPVQAAYFEKNRCQTELNSCQKHLQQSEKNLAAARSAVQSATSLLEEKERALAIGAADPRQQRMLAQAVESAQRKKEKCEEKLRLCRDKVRLNQDNIQQAQLRLEGATAHFNSALVEFLSHFPDEVAPDNM